MNIRDFMDLDKLQSLQNDFTAATGLAAVIVDKDGSYLTRESGFTDFYKKYEDEIKKTNDTGLLTFSVDIIIENEKVCSIEGGQALASIHNDDQLKAKAEALNVNVDSYMNSIHKLPVRSEAHVESAARLLETAVTKLLTFEYAQSGNVGKLGQLSAEITHANDTIQKINTYTHSLKSIANKQKMLSLNASIEAARSGEAGVGFTVVAKSMGDLSSQSAAIYGDIEKSVTEVTEIIENLASIFDNQEQK